MDFSRRCALLALGLTACGTEPPPVVAVAAARDLGAVTTSSSIRGRDGGYSALFQGHSVWAYGDTILAHEDEDGLTWHNNSASWTRDLDASDGIDGFQHTTDSIGAPDWLLPLNSAENEASTSDRKLVLWPGPIVPVPDSDAAWLLYSKLEVTPNDFESVATSIALWNDIEAQPDRLVLGQDGLLFGPDDPRLSEGAVVFENDLYLFDCAGFSKGCVVAKAAVAEVTTRQAWRFYDGNDWVASAKSATTVLNGHDIMTVHYNSDLDTFLAVYSKPLSNDIMARSAPRPEGPWSSATKIADAQPSHDGAVAYSAVAHPELAQGSTEFVSYHRGTGAFASEIRLLQIDFTATR